MTELSRPENHEILGEKEEVFTADDMNEAYNQAHDLWSAYHEQEIAKLKFELEYALKGARVEAEKVDELQKENEELKKTRLELIRNTHPDYEERCDCEPHFEMPQEIRCSRCHKILPQAKLSKGLSKWQIEEIINKEMGCGIHTHEKVVKLAQALFNAINTKEK